MKIHYTCKEVAEILGITRENLSCRIAKDPILKDKFTQLTYKVRGRGNGEYVLIKDRLEDTLTYIGMDKEMILLVLENLKIINK